MIEFGPYFTRIVLQMEVSGQLAIISQEALKHLD
jgi:hypothetical protein